MHRFPTWAVLEKPTQTVSKAAVSPSTGQTRNVCSIITSNRNRQVTARICAGQQSPTKPVTGLHVTARPPWQFSIVPFADSNIDASTHINQLKRSGTVTVHLDAEQAGVGTATCGPGVLPQYLVPVKKTMFEFVIRPIK